jgi:hypothetical protein
MPQLIAPRAIYHLPIPPPPHRTTRTTYSPLHLHHQCQTYQVFILDWREEGGEVRAWIRAQMSILKRVSDRLVKQSRKRPVTHHLAVPHTLASDNLASHSTQTVGLTTAVSCLVLVCLWAAGEVAATSHRLEDCLPVQDLESMST